MKPEHYYEKELIELQRRFEAGHLPDLHRAIEACAIWNIPVPRWASTAVLSILAEHFHSAPVRGGRGKSSPKGVFKRDYADWLCWMHVEGGFRIDALDHPTSRCLGPKLTGGRPRRGEAERRASVLKNVAARLKDTVASTRTRQQIIDGWQRVQDAQDRGEDARYRGF
jgi:hypothetical protein